MFCWRQKQETLDWSWVLSIVIKTAVRYLCTCPQAPTSGYSFIKASLSVRNQTHRGWICGKASSSSSSWWFRCLSHNFINISHWWTATTRTGCRGCSSWKCYSKVKSLLHSRKQAPQSVHCFRLFFSLAEQGGPEMFPSTASQTWCIICPQRSRAGGGP